MRGRAVGRRRVVGLAVTLSAGLAAWNNVVVHRLPAPRVSYVLANAAATGAVLAAGRWVGLSWDEVGLGRPRLPAGLRWGGAGSLAVGAGYATALATPVLRPLLRDARVVGREPADLAYQALVRIPLGTVLWEETAFRGVLPAVLTRLLSPRSAVVASSLLFGIWHVRPTLDGLAANDLVRGRAARSAAVAGACLGTAAGGALFSGLRLRSGSLLAPVLLHLATNVFGLLAADAAIRWPRPDRPASVSRPR